MRCECFGDVVAPEVIDVPHMQATAVFVFASSTFGEVGVSNLTELNFHLGRASKHCCSELYTMQAAIGLEYIGLPPVAAGLAVLVVALVVLDTFNQSVLGEGTLNNPVNSLGFAAAGKGPFASHVLRMVSCSCLPRQFTCAHLCNAPF